MPEQLQEKGIKILEWYLENQRDLPWRKTTDPYKIWVSEIMLQQTRVDTVIDYYNRFIERFPDAGTLAAAREDEVLVAWKGLGYYTRARNLHQAAKVIADCYQGEYPKTYEDVRKLPGIGAYTAGAILSIAFNQPYAAIDGNVLRVVSRLEGIGEDITKDSTKKKFSEIVHKMIPEGKARDFSQAMMELGALVCVPGEPSCEECRVRACCMACKEGLQRELPFKEKKVKQNRELHYWMAVIERNGRLLLEYRKDETLLAKMWGLPMMEKCEGILPEMLFADKYKLQLKHSKTLGNAVHVFTHQVWRMDVARYFLEEGAGLPESLHWVELEKLEELAVPTAFKRALRLIYGTAI